MPETIITYDKPLPEISNRRSWERPTSFLVKDESAESGWRIDDSGRRSSKMLLANKLREAVDAWREGDPQKGIEPYSGASEVTKRLFTYWFEEEHEVSGFDPPFHYYFCQREAIETLVYLIEICKVRDSVPLVEKYAEDFRKDLFTPAYEFQTTMEGQRQICRYNPKRDAVGMQDVPPENLRRYAFKMATGSGKTWVMAMAMVWAHFHKKLVPDSSLSTNFLVVAPNIIVYQRLEKDFSRKRLFHQIPLIPPEWKNQWNPKVILRGESSEPEAGGNIFVTNIHQIYESREQGWSPQNAVEALLGRKPNKDLSSYNRSMFERLKSLPDLIVFNDEAHHVHDDDLSWNKTLLALNNAIPKGLSLWLDFSATPKDQHGMYYPWTICDYPLAQAVEDRIVKAPIVVTLKNDPKRPQQDPENVTKDNVVEKYRYWIESAAKRWRDHLAVYKKLKIKPVLFIMTEKNVFADAIGKELVENKEYGLRKSEVQIIHTDSKGEVRKSDLAAAREAVRDIDKPGNKIKAIVSVMMLREGWDVKNVTVTLGLRPFTAKSKILPEQVVGRGLRLIPSIGPDTQTLEVLGTQRLLADLKNQLEAEGVGIGEASDPPPLPIWIEPVQEKIEYDISLPITKPSLFHNIKKLDELNPMQLGAIYDQAEHLADEYRISLKMEFITTETEVHQEDITSSRLPFSQESISAITNKVMRNARLPNVFARLYPIVREYVVHRCFGRAVDVENEKIRSHLREANIQDGIAKYLAGEIGKLTIEERKLEFENDAFRLSNVKPFQWRRNLRPSPLQCSKTIFNYVATYNDFERRFAAFLENAPDVLQFAALGTTEQGSSGTQFKIDYLKPNGAIGFYFPDWIAVQKTPAREINWIIETKGRVWEGTEAKDDAMLAWCSRISSQSGESWRYMRVNQAEFDVKKPATLTEAFDLAAVGNMIV